MFLGKLTIIFIRVKGCSRNIYLFINLLNHLHPQEAGVQLT
jgi:hypothetical protein